MSKPKGITVSDGYGTKRTLFRMRKENGVVWSIKEGDSVTTVSADSSVAAMTDPTRFLMPLRCIDLLAPFSYEGSPVSGELRMSVGADDYVIVHVSGHVTTWEPRVDWVEL